MSLTRRAVAVAVALALFLGNASAIAQTPTSSPTEPTDTLEADTSALVGTWQGQIQLGRDSLRVVFHVERDGDSLSATMDSPDQGATGIPVGEVQLTADTLRMSVPSISGAFAGVIKGAAAGLIVDGQWAQGPGRLPLTLRRVEAAPEVRRPQTPAPPYPYRADTVAFRNASAGIALSGTLTRPPSDSVGPAGAPAVVLVAGSGAQDRDGTLLGHEPLHVLADHLTRRGIAVLRFDERGVGASGGTQRGATTEDFAGDVQAAVGMLAEQDGIDPGRIGVIGHSEGGLIAPMTANRSDHVGFVVLLAAPGLPGREVLADQLERIGKSSGADERTIAIQRGTQQRILQALSQDADSAEIATDLKQVMREAQGISSEEAIESEVRRLMTPWFRYFVNYDPRPALRDLDVPVLAIAGSKDTQVAADDNLAAIEQALKAGANPPHTMRTFDGLNHLLQTAETGAPQEYGRIEETVAPRVLDQIATWIQEKQ